MSHASKQRQRKSKGKRRPRACETSPLSCLDCSPSLHCCPYKLWVQQCPNNLAFNFTSSFICCVNFFVRLFKMRFRSCHSVSNLQRFHSSSRVKFRTHRDLPPCSLSLTSLSPHFQHLSWLWFVLPLVPSCGWFLTSKS